MQVQTVFEELLFTTVRLETRGTNTSGVGTGFIFNYELGDDRALLFVVTNRHVVEDCSSVQFFLTKQLNGQPEVGHGITIELGAQGIFYPHPNEGIDIAVAPFAPILQELQTKGHEVFFKAIPNSLIPTEEQWQALDAIEEIVFVGYPIAIYDRVNLMPIIRQGICATPLQLDYEGRPAFLIDASVFRGSSGSPVLIWRSGYHTDRQGNIMLGQGRLHFIGVIAGTFGNIEKGRIDLEVSPSALSLVSKTEQMIDLGLVYKSTCVMEAVKSFLENHGNPIAL